MVIIRKEYKIMSKVETFMEQNVPLYEPIFIPVKAYALDKIHSLEVRKVISKDDITIFKDIYIETINQCNGTCAFCPTNRYADSRVKKLMDSKLFYNVIGQLQAISYTGNVGLFLNNEPLLDGRLNEFLAYTKKALPEALVHIYTNGTLLTIDYFNSIIKNLDRIHISNYNNEGKLNKPVEKLFNYLVENPEYSDRISISIIRTNAIRDNRAGLAKNRTKVYGLNSPCIYPFWRMCIQTDGKVSLCRNDVFGAYTLGDTNTQSLVDIWYNDSYKNIRDRMREGRNMINMCKQCDSYFMFPKILHKLSFTKNYESVAKIHNKDSIKYT